MINIYSQRQYHLRTNIFISSLLGNCWSRTLKAAIHTQQQRARYERAFWRRQVLKSRSLPIVARIYRQSSHHSIQWIEFLKLRRKYFQKQAKSFIFCQVLCKSWDLASSRLICLKSCFLLHLASFKRAKQRSVSLYRPFFCSFN